jgi:sugar (pentulose or hexulose) kinase
MRILAFDVGTSSVKAAVLDVATAAAGGPVARVVYELDHPASEAAEVPADRLWSAVSAASREAVHGIDGVEAIGMACLTPALVLLDAAHRPRRRERTSFPGRLAARDREIISAAFLFWWERQIAN